MDAQQRILKVGTAIVGSGAAAYNAAVTLSEKGVTDLAVITEGRLSGTSRNTGSDKQTYYKLSLAGNTGDSVWDMANDLFAPGCVDGDIAMTEAAMSTTGFLHLARLGVPFPTNVYGEYVGYKTDHDPRARATSAGPLTSKMMTEALENEFNRRGLTLYDNLYVIRILTDERGAYGLVAIDSTTPDGQNPLVLILCRDVIWATGGPAGIYSDTVYPVSHNGCNAVPFRAGVRGRNLTEWQYGLASVNPRWNVSGTYMQVLPRVVSVDADGQEHEFIQDYFKDLGKSLSMLFLKGYQWPFDSRRAIDGSSLLDLLVYRECALFGRRVYLDYTQNPNGLDEIPYDSLSEEARTYLTQAKACFGKPIDRLRFMNEPAYQLYLSFGVDLTKEKLEIALCAQHNNGGLDVDLWWQTNVEHLFACGECAGTHGVYRPGGSALNAGQVGSTRAATYIATKAPKDKYVPTHCDLQNGLSALEEEYKFICTIATAKERNDNTQKLLDSYRSEMSKCAGPIREAAAIGRAKDARKASISIFMMIVKACGTMGYIRAYRLYNTLIEQWMYLEAMYAYCLSHSPSRGSALYTDENGRCAEGLEDIFRMVNEGDKHLGEIQLVDYLDGNPQVSVRPVTPLPEGGGFFENIWRQFREDGFVGHTTNDI